MRPSEDGGSASGRLVGRDRECACFLEWLHGPGARGAAVLYVWGRAGAGKTALLRTLADMARAQGRRVMPLPAPPPSRDGPPTVCVLDTPTDGSAAAAAMGRLGPLLQAGCAVVAAGRLRPELARAAVGEDAEWADLALGPLGPDAARALLRRAGWSGAAVMDEVLALAGRNPAALQSAAYALQDATGALQGLPAWRLAAHGLAERIVGECPAELRPVLEACSVLFRVEQGTLAAVGGPRAANAFGELCRLSLMIPLSEGLTMHPEARRILEADLRWRNPERWHDLRTRARAHFERRVRRSGDAERQGLVVDQLFLADHPVVRAAAFGDEDPGVVLVGSGGPSLHPALLGLWTEWVRRQFHLPSVGEVETAELGRILHYRGTRVRIARHRSGACVGFSAIVPVCRESVRLLRDIRVTSAVLDAWWSRPEVAALPATPETSRVFFVHHIAETAAWSADARSVLLRDALGLLALGGTYFASAAVPELQALLEALGFERVPGARNTLQDSVHPVEGFVLDLTQGGYAAWMEALQRGVPLQCAGGGAQLERALQDALPRWNDDRWIATSPLALRLRPWGAGSGHMDPEAVRKTIREALDRARREAPADLQAAFQALDLSYLVPDRGSHEQVARRLGVSRSTFYRLLRRAVHLLAEELRREDGGGTAAE